MRTLYLDLGMGAAGDMLTAALLELTDNKDRFVSIINSLMPDSVEVTARESTKCGIVGTHMHVAIDGLEEHEHEHHHHHDHDHDHEHHHHHHHEHASMSGVEEIIDGLFIPENVKRDAINVYKIIADAESKVHGVPVTEIHFHEVGSLDAVVDVVSVCLLMDKIKPEKVIASPVHVGSGTVKCAHGVLPVPAPATANILSGIPIYSGEIKGELCTPTGAALLKYFVDEFASMPVMTVERIGYGMGHKDFPQANCVRALLGTTSYSPEDIIELTCNIDDMTPERIGFASELLMDEGALDVYTTPVVMKKSRPGFLFSVICKESVKDKLVNLIFKHTTTLGIRENISRRYTLNRKVETVSTQYGDVRVKKSEGFGVDRSKYEYEDLARIAREKGISIEEVISTIK